MSKLMLTQAPTIFIMSILTTLMLMFSSLCMAATKKSPETEWLNIIVHGAVGFQANFSYKTILQAQNDCIEGTDYERNVLNIREEPYLFTLQPMQKMGLHPVVEQENMLSASYAFAVLFQEVQRACSINEKGEFYTFGWSGLISEKRRYAEACILFKQLQEQISAHKKLGKYVKIRLIGYSHGATLLLNLAEVAKDFPPDTVTIDELHLVGLPVIRVAHAQIRSPIFKKIYNIYSRGDKAQRLDVFSADFFSHREFKGCLPEGLTQIEMKLTACLRRNPRYSLPQRMRGMFNQSPGHIELWFFGWASSSYRKNLSFYPMPGAVLIPYLICAAQKLPSKHVIVDIRPEQEKICVRSRYDFTSITVPFMNQADYTALIKKAMEFHPSNPKYKDSFMHMQTNIHVNAYM